MPQTLKRISVALFAIQALFLLLFGLIYINANAMRPFHADAVSEASRMDVLPLYVALMRLIGGASIGLALLGGYVVAGPMRQGAFGAATVVSACFAFPVLVAAFTAVKLAETGAPTSWRLMGVFLSVTGVALAIHFAAARLQTR